MKKKKKKEEEEEVSPFGEHHPAARFETFGSYIIIGSGESFFFSSCLGDGKVLFLPEEEEEAYLIPKKDATS